MSGLKKITYLKKKKKERLGKKDVLKAVNTLAHTQTPT